MSGSDLWMHSGRHLTSSGVVVVMMMMMMRLFGSRGPDVLFLMPVHPVPHILLSVFFIIFIISQGGRLPVSMTFRRPMMVT